MLTVDLVRARKKGNELVVTRLDRKGQERAVEIATDLVNLFGAHVGSTRDELAAALRELAFAGAERKIADGLAKLVDDRTRYASSGDVDAIELRRDVFLRSSRARASGQTFNRNAVLAEVAEERSTTASAIEEALYSDLKGAQRVVAVDELRPETLVASYESAQAQAVLLRAVRVVADVTCRSPEAYRDLFRKLKFRRLLHRSVRTDEGYRIEIDGPFSLFESVTKYGLQLALVLPALEACDSLRLEASVRWGKAREPLTFRLERKATRPDDEEVRLPEELDVLTRAMEKAKSPWVPRSSSEIFEVPGVGLCVPDLVFVHESTRRRVYLELLGYWSREAVWRRVELAERGLDARILFAVSKRLRVSEEVLDDVEAASLYVFKGALSASAVTAKLDLLAR